MHLIIKDPKKFVSVILQPHNIAKYYVFFMGNNKPVLTYTCIQSNIYAFAYILNGSVEVDLA